MRRRTGYRALAFFFTAAVTAAASFFPFGTAVLSEHMETAYATSYQPDIDREKEHLKELEARRKETEKRLAELEAEKEDLTSYIRKLDEEQENAYAQLRRLEAEIADCEGRIAETEEALEAAKLQKEEQYNTMKARIKYLYENGESSFLELFMAAESLSDILNQVEYRSKISEYDAALFDRYKETIRLVEEKEAQYRLQLAELNGAKELQQLEIDSLNTWMAAKAEEMERLTESLGISEELYFEYFDEITQQKLTIAELEEKEAARIEEERRLAEEEERRRKEREEAERLAALAGVTLTDESALDKMIWPFPGDGNVYSYFGSRVSPITGKQEWHTGWDIGGAYGSDIVAALAGTVTRATYSVSNGNFVVLDHGNGIETYYLHGSQIMVSVGDYVQQGQVVLKCGSTGWSTGPHLHFTIKINNVAVDPGLYIKYNK